MNDRGDYRRNETDVMTSNGYIYNLAGKFTAVLTGNQKDQRRPAEGAVIDASQGNLVMPRFYDPYQSPAIGDCSCVETPEGKRIYLAVGDRLYSDPTVNDLVVGKEMIHFPTTHPIFRCSLLELWMDPLLTLGGYDIKKISISLLIA